MLSRYTALALLFSLIWSSAFIAVKIGLPSSPPLFLMASRFLVAGAVLVAWALVRSARMPRGPREWAPLAALGLLNFSLYLGLTAIALQHLSAGMGAVLASTNPLMLAVLAPWVLGERVGPLKITGIVTSFTGVVWLMHSRIGDDNRPGAMVLVVVSIMCLVAGTLLFKRMRLDYDLLVLNGTQLLAAGVFLIVPSLLLEPVRDVRLDLSFLAAQAYLVVVVSWIGMATWFWLLRAGDATRASAWFFLNPVLGLLLGALLLGEPLRPQDLAGAAAVAAGIYLVQRA
ncbi:MAG TPA: EamA family transporter [Candidatus Limnocylindria bacterium]|nr:EamA family transporter [Candidatus Limnocylindria bacterium]